MIHLPPLNKLIKKVQGFSVSHSRSVYGTPEHPCISHESHDTSVWAVHWDTVCLGMWYYITEPRTIRDTGLSICLWDVILIALTEKRRPSPPCTHTYTLWAAPSSSWDPGRCKWRKSWAAAACVTLSWLWCDVTSCFFPTRIHGILTCEQSKSFFFFLVTVGVFIVAIKKKEERLRHHHFNS